MKRVIRGFLSLFAGCALTLGAEELIKNGGFEAGTEGWVVKGKCSVDAADKTEGKQSLLVTKKPGLRFDEIRQEVKVEPETDYELSYCVKCSGLEKADPQVKAYGVSASITGGGKRRCYGAEGLWKYDHGTFDWKKAVVRFNTRDFGNPGTLLIGLQCPSAAGTFRLDAVSLRKPAKEPFRISLFPLGFLNRQTYTVAENLVGTVFLTSRKDKNTQYAEGTPAVMILDLPPFLRLAGITDRFIVKRGGKYAQIAYPFTEKEITRGGKPYRRYTVSFDPIFVRLLGASWYHQKMFLIPEKGSAGKTGTMHWSFMIGGQRQKEVSHAVAVRPAIPKPEAPCRRFSFDVGYSSVHVSPFPELRKIMTPFWQGLVERPSLQLDMGEGSDPAFTAVCVLNGDDTCVDMPHGRAAWAEYRKKTPKDVKATGRAAASSPSWYKLEDPGKLYESFLRESLRTALKLHPEIRVFKWDYEPERTGYDPEGRARFARHLKLDHTPSIAEIQQKYRAEWRKYTLELNARFISKAAKIAKEEAPDRLFVVVSELLSNNEVSRWCDVDMRLIDKDPNIDFLDGMPYFCGAEFFDEVKRNRSALRKPLLLSQDPSERLWSFWSKYTPGRLYQNILAAAAQGVRGICHWPDDSMTAEYYRSIADAYALIARYENVYFDGKRVDGEFAVTPQNTFTKTVSDGVKKLLIHFPDFAGTLRTTAHEYRGKYYFTLFNYNEKEAVIVRIAGNGKDLLARIPAGGAEVVEAERPGDQAALRKELEEFRSKASGGTIEDLVDGKNSVAWALGAAGKPVLRLANARFRADIDAMNDGMVVGFRQESGADPMAGGKAGRVIFYDTEQPRLSFVQKSVSLRNGIPAAVFEAEVPAYEGALARENPLQGMKITKTYSLTPEGLKVAFRFFNPSKHAMKFGFRIWNFPQTGSRFGRRNLKLACGNAEITPSAPENHYFLKRAKAPAGKDVHHRWNGEKAVSSAADGALRESIEFIPAAGFDGIYVWNSHGSTPGHTVELKSPELTLQPGAAMEFSYLIR